MKLSTLILVLLLLSQNARTQILSLPPRPADALSGSEFAQSLISLDRTNREDKIYEAVAHGNVPDFLRKLVPVTAQDVHDGKTNSATYYVTPDYLAVGSDENYFLAPLSPIIAQKVADLVHCTLPTRKMVNDIYTAATVKLIPSPIPPGPTMATVPVFIQHNLTVCAQRKEQIHDHLLGALVAGDKKDVVISRKLDANPGKVAIYGWHKPDGKPIQPLYTGHADYYADYSHGIRLVQSALVVNGEPQTIPQVLADTNLAPLLSDEGVLTNDAYPATFQIRAAPTTTVATAPETMTNFQTAPFDEKFLAYTYDPEVKVLINEPAQFAPGKKLKLIFFALPNGNSTAQTIGKKTQTNDDWHYDIQHIGAQTRFLRRVLTNTSIVVVYLEAADKSIPRSWPTWRKDHADHPEIIPQLIDSIKARFKDFDVQVTLGSHSGGGAFMFGYINAQEHLPNDLERIAFLDSDYNYDAKLGHAEKLLQWLRASDQHYLSVLAYNDAVALLKGKSFVSTNGGTWGRTHAMLKDLAELNFTSTTNADLETYTALNGRVKFILKENPEQKIYHTVQVERNGFIQTILSGTPYEGQGYVYFGPRAYANWIAPE